MKNHCTKAYQSYQSLSLWKHTHPPRTPYPRRGRGSWGCSGLHLRLYWQSCWYSQSLICLEQSEKVVAFQPRVKIILIIYNLCRNFNFSQIFALFALHGNSLFVASISCLQEKKEKHTNKTQNASCPHTCAHTFYYPYTIQFFAPPFPPSFSFLPLPLLPPLPSFLPPSFPPHALWDICAPIMTAANISTLHQIRSLFRRDSPAKFAAPWAKQLNTPTNMKSNHSKLVVCAREVLYNHGWCYQQVSDLLFVLSILT